MNCQDARQRLGAEPARRTPELEAHLAGCAACTQYAADMARLEAGLKRALAVDVPEPAQVALPAARRRAPRATLGWLALAASLAGLAVLVATLWSVYPREALAGALADHMAHEPESWQRTDVAVPADSLAAVLSRSGVAFSREVPLVSYAMSCKFRGWYVPHLVVQTAGGPITVMILPHERVPRPTPLDEAGYRGVIVPAAHGAIAVVSRGPVPAATTDEVVARVTAAVRFPG